MKTFKQFQEDLNQKNPFSMVNKSYEHLIEIISNNILMSIQMNYKNKSVINKFVIYDTSRRT